MDVILVKDDDRQFDCGVCAANVGSRTKGLDIRSLSRPLPAQCSLLVRFAEYINPSGPYIKRGWPSDAQTDGHLCEV